MSYQRVFGAVFSSWASDLAPLPREAKRRAWAFLRPEHLRALSGLVVSLARVVLQRDVRPFVFCSRSVPVFGCLSSIIDPLNGLNYKI